MYETYVGNQEPLSGITFSAPNASTSGSGKIWLYAIAACLVLAVGIEEEPKIGVPFAALIIFIMLVTWKGIN